MIIPPSTNITILDCPLVNDQANQLTFATKSAQQSYFISRPLREFRNLTYIRDSQSIRLAIPYAEAVNYNYAFYNNPDNPDKIYYAFLTKPRYISNEVTEFDIDTDVYQTWCFDIAFKPSFIEREHTNDDTVGNNTLPEGLETGEYIPNEYIPVDFINLTSNSAMLCMQVTQLPVHPDQGSAKPAYQQYFEDNSKIINGLPTSAKYLVFGISGDSAGVGGGLDNLFALLDSYNQWGQIDAVLSIFPIPQRLSIFTSSISQTPWNTLVFLSNQKEEYIINTTVVTKPTTVDGYTPHNKKLLTFPYCYFYYNNFTGGTQEYHYEDFNNNPSFQTTMAITAGINAKISPINYKNMDEHGGFGYGMSIGNVPLASWINDIYANWLALNQNQQQNYLNNLGLNFAKGLIGSIPSSVAGNTNNAGVDLTGVAVDMGLKATLGAIDWQQGINGLMAERADHAKVPVQAGGDTRNAPLNYAYSKADGGFYSISVRKDYAKRIDDYFDFFGYATNQVKLPNITGRRNWNYVKSAYLNIEGEVPQIVKDEIKNMFIHGVTFWHNPNTIFDYSQNNDII